MTGIERLKNMIEGQFQKPLFKIYMYLKTRTDMYEKYLNPEKSMSQMYEYIKKQAEKQKINGVAMIEDSVVYGLAIHYFDETNENLGIKKNKTQEKQTIITPSEIISKLNLKYQKEEREQISLFDGEI